MSSFGRHHAFGAGALLAGLAVASAVALWPSRRLVDERPIRAAERLSDAARAAVKTQMRAHREAVLDLVSAVTVLDYDGAIAATDRVLIEPRIARPTTSDATELNNALPARFFALQDQLHDELVAVRAAAAARDGDKLADTFGAATRTCVRCHQTYEEGR